MRLTNKHKLPDAIFKAVSNDPYSRGKADISVTQLCDSPRLVQLYKRHADKMSEDVSDRLFSLLGQAVHHILHRAADDNALTEERLFIEVNGYKLSGSPDVFTNDGTLIDYKVSKAQVLSMDTKETWLMQLRTYAWLLRKHGFEVKKAQLCVLIRDWWKFQALRDHEYPQAPMAMVDVPLWPDEKIQKWIEERVMLHKGADLIKDDSLPDCSDKETWRKEAAWAVVKDGSRRAFRVFDNVAEAEACLDNQVRLKCFKGKIVYRPGEATRCEHYCLAKSAGVCSQYNRSVPQGLESVKI